MSEARETVARAAYSLIWRLIYRSRPRGGGRIVGTYANANLVRAPDGIRRTGSRVAYTLFIIYRSPAFVFGVVRDTTSVSPVWQRRPWWWYVARVYRSAAGRGRPVTAGRCRTRFVRRRYKRFAVRDDRVRSLVIHRCFSVRDDKRGPHGRYSLSFRPNSGAFYVPVSRASKFPKISAALFAVVIRRFLVTTQFFRVIHVSNGVQSQLVRRILRTFTRYTLLGVIRLEMFAYANLT